RGSRNDSEPGPRRVRIDRRRCPLRCAAEPISARRGAAEVPPPTAHQSSGDKNRLRSSDEPCPEQRSSGSVSKPCHESHRSHVVSRASRRPGRLPCWHLPIREAELTLRWSVSVGRLTDPPTGAHIAGQRCGTAKERRHDPAHNPESTDSHRSGKPDTDRLRLILGFERRAFGRRFTRRGCPGGGRYVL